MRTSDHLYFAIASFGLSDCKTISKFPHKKRRFSYARQSHSPSANASAPLLCSPSSPDTILTSRSRLFPHVTQESCNTLPSAKYKQRIDTALAYPILKAAAAFCYTPSKLLRFSLTSFILHFYARTFYALYLPLTNSSP